MTAIKSVPLQLGDIILTRDGTKVEVTDTNTVLVEGDIVYHKSGSITQVKGDGRDDVLLDIDGKLTENDKSDDKATATATDSGYSSFWRRMFGAGNKDQDSALLLDRGADYESRSTKIRLTPTPSTQGSSPSGSKITGNAAAQILLENLDWKAKKYYSLNDLRALSKSISTSTETKEAIAWFIAHPEDFTKMELNEGAKKDNLFGKNNLARYIANPNQTGQYDAAGNRIKNSSISGSKITGNAAANILLENLDWNGKKLFTLKDLRELRNKSGTSLETKNAIDWFIAHGDDFTKMELSTTGRKDQTFNKQNLRAYIANPNQIGEYDANNKMTGIGAAQTLLPYLKPGHSGLYSKEYLEALKNKDDTPQKTKDAIQWFLDNPNEFDKMEANTGTKDNVFSWFNMNHYIDQLNKKGRGASTPTPVTPTPVTPTPVTPTPVTPTPVTPTPVTPTPVTPTLVTTEEGLTKFFWLKTNDEFIQKLLTNGKLDVDKIRALLAATDGITAEQRSVLQYLQEKHYPLDPIYSDGGVANAALIAQLQIDLGLVFDPMSTDTYSMEFNNHPEYIVRQPANIEEWEAFARNPFNKVFIDSLLNPDKTFNADKIHFLNTDPHSSLTAAQKGFLQYMCTTAGIVGPQTGDLSSFDAAFVMEPTSLDEWKAIASNAANVDFIKSIKNGDDTYDAGKIFALNSDPNATLTEEQRGLLRYMIRTAGITGPQTGNLSAFNSAFNGVFNQAQDQIKLTGLSRNSVVTLPTDAEALDMIQKGLDNGDGDFMNSIRTNPDGGLNGNLIRWYMDGNGTCTKAQMGLIQYLYNRFYKDNSDDESPAIIDFCLNQTRLFNPQKRNDLLAQ